MAYVDEIMVFSSGVLMFFLIGIGMTKTPLWWALVGIGSMYAVPLWAKMARGFTIAP